MLANTIDCSGASTGVCGVLVIETGLGSGVYNHTYPAVHGLWPEVSPYGNSQCVAPGDTTDPSQIFSCYNHSNVGSMQINSMTPLAFEVHEWEKHGLCAGVQNATDFFTQICELASIPLAIVGKNDISLSVAQQAVMDSGYEVFGVDTTNAQVELSACLNPQGYWILSPVSNFANVC